jgi:hypothetical protein
MSEQNVARSLVSVAELARRLTAFGERVLVLPIGVPGSGKSTLSLNLLKEAAFVRINADSILRKGACGSWWIAASMLRSPRERTSSWIT